MRGTATPPFVYHQTDANDIRSPGRVIQSIPECQAQSLQKISLKLHEDGNTYFTIGVSAGAQPGAHHLS